MSQTEHFAPSVMIDGNSVQVEGWMVVLAFAIRGIPWAVKEALDPKFDMRGKVDNYYKRIKHHQTEHYQTNLQHIHILHHLAALFY